MWQQLQRTIEWHIHCVLLLLLCSALMRACNERAGFPEENTEETRKKEPDRRTAGTCEMSNRGACTGIMLLQATVPLGKVASFACATRSLPLGAWGTAPTTLRGKMKNAERGKRREQTSERQNHGSSVLRDRRGNKELTLCMRWGPSQHPQRQVQQENGRPLDFHNATTLLAENSGCLQRHVEGWCWDSVQRRMSVRKWKGSQARSKRESETHTRR